MLLTKRSLNCRAVGDVSLIAGLQIVEIIVDRATYGAAEPVTYYYSPSYVHPTPQPTPWVYQLLCVMVVRRRSFTTRYGVDLSPDFCVE